MKAILPLLFLLSAPVMAQELDCDGNRYQNQIFANVDSVKDVQYGQALTLAGKTQNLLMDIYEPVGDTLAIRPLIVMAHGGSFISGGRSQTAEFCVDFARRGYVVANIEYRLIDFLVLDSLGMFEAVIMAINDMRAAVRYFREDAAFSNKYGIATDYIFVAGVSAGAIMANHLGFLDPGDEVPEYLQEILAKHGGFEGNSSENTQYSSNVQGVINYSGGLLRSSWIDSEDVPVYSAHDDQDPVVPCNYNKSIAVPFPVYLYGSCAMKSVADQMDITNRLYLVSNSTGHVSYLNNESTKKLVLQESAAFLESIICGGSGTASERQWSHDPGAFVYPNPVADILHIKTEAKVRAITISNLMGQNFIELNNPSGNHLDLSSLPKGIYLIQLKSDCGISVFKVVKE